MRSSELDFRLGRRPFFWFAPVGQRTARQHHPPGIHTRHTSQRVRPTGALTFSIFRHACEDPRRRMVHCWPGYRAVAVLALAMAAQSEAANVTFKNQCEYSIDVYDNSNVCSVSPGTSKSPTFGCGREIPGTTMYRHKKSPQATLAEFAYGSGKAWYDISIIPPGPDNCGSLSDCQKYTGKTGFNVPVMILPTKYLDAKEFRCQRIMCQYDGCPDAFHYPKDNEKVYNCPDDEQFHVIYCP